MKQVTMESVKQRIAVLESAGKIVGVLGLGGEFELACLRELVAVTEHSERVSKSLETALGVQADQAKRTNQLLGEIKKAEAVIGSLGWMGLDTAISLELTKLNKQISDLQGQVSLLTEQRDALVVENATLREAAEFAIAPDMWEELGGNVLRYQYQEWYADKLKAALTSTATSSAIAALRAEGVEMFAQHCDDSIGFVEPEDEELYTLMEEQAREFARQLRESKGANHA